jgi:hypothetical protein
MKKILLVLLLTFSTIGLATHHSHDDNSSESMNQGKQSIVGDRFKIDQQSILNLQKILKKGKKLLS